MNQRACLFIGGPWDGRRIHVEPGMDPVLVSDDALATPARVPVREYRRQVVVGLGGVEFVVYHYGKQDTVSMLIEGYRRP